MRRRTKHKLGKTVAPRTKELNEALMSKRGGRHYSEHTDYDRAKEKHKIREFIDTEI